jgi:hypothetical protein
VKHPYRRALQAEAHPGAFKFKVKIAGLITSNAERRRLQPGFLQAKRAPTENSELHISSSSVASHSPYARLRAWKDSAWPEGTRPARHLALSQIPLMHPAPSLQISSQRISPICSISPSRPNVRNSYNRL